MERTILGLALALTLGSVAQAEPARQADAVLRVAPSVQDTAVLDGRMWKCLGTGCRGRAVTAPKSQPVMFECQRVAAQFGELSHYRSGKKVFSEPELARCNTTAKARSPATEMAARP